MTLRIPLATYRLQFNRSFTFRDAQQLIDYLDDLGVSDVYASPFLAARPGSPHGYDVVDHSRLNPELGTDEDLDALAGDLRSRSMGILMDVVPNHMCIATSTNRWWNDVLENGRSSPFARFFDIDWHPPKMELNEKILLPVLGEQYGRVLESQEISIGYESGAFFTRYWQAQFPLGPRTITPLLEPVVDELRRLYPDDDAALLELESILTAIRHLPRREETEEEKVRERQREKEIVKKRIAALVESSQAVRSGIERSLRIINGEKGQPRTFDRLETLLADQGYRLSYWVVAAEEINYRRFFDINDLAAIRVEQPTVLEAVHQKAFQLLREGKVSGLRIDHVDGLLDPAGYLEELQAPPASDRSPCYVVVEKILTGDECLPSEWPVQGTTGYDFLNMLNGIFVDPEAERPFDRLYQRLRHTTGSFDDQLYAAKKLILRSALSSELYVLARRLDRISEQHRWSRDFTMNSLHDALGEVVACFPVYRSYLRLDSTEVSGSDRQHILTAVRAAKRRNRSTSASIFDFIGDLLLLRDPEGLSESDLQERRDFIVRLQQLTGPVMAKGLEDTVFYRYFPLASLNEVGGRPAPFGISADRFHEWNLRRQREWPHSLSATATHDTKRGEDVRARLNVLSEMPRDWQIAVRRWQRLNRRHKVMVEEVSVPELNEEYLLYQTLVGAWPLASTQEERQQEQGQARGHQELVDRVCAYMNKAIKEAKLHTSWINLNEAYERGVDQFVRAILADRPDNPFPEELRRFQAAVAMPGVFNSLSQLILKITAPGVPDFYQGTELWDFSLVDPDNRRPVDYPGRRSLLAAIQESAGGGSGNGPGKEPHEVIRTLLGKCEDGGIKLYLTHRALQFRRRRRQLFETGSYLPLWSTGARSRNVISFARDLDGAAAVVAAGRFFAGLGAASNRPVGPEIWGDSTLALARDLRSGEYRNALTGRSVWTGGDGGRTLLLAEVFADLPVAILEWVGG
jgi:(1->4)-alpha-D-glucan 1-alpha-D-glucosylmutase